MAIHKKQLIWIAILIAILLLTFGWGVNEHIGKLSCLHAKQLAEKNAKKDSVKAKQAYYTVQNFGNPVAITVDTVKHLTYLAVQNDGIAAKHQQQVAYIHDTIKLPSEQDKDLLTKYTAINQKQDDIIAQQAIALNRTQWERDSFKRVAQNLTFSNKYLTLNQTERAAQDSTDSSYNSTSVKYNYTAHMPVTFVNVPHTIFGRHYGSKGTMVEIRSEDSSFHFSISDSAKFALRKHGSYVDALAETNTDQETVLRFMQSERENGAVLSFTVNYGVHSNVWQVGPGLRYYFMRMFNIYAALYYNITRKYINPTLSFTGRILKF